MPDRISSAFHFSPFRKFFFHKPATAMRKKCLGNQHISTQSVIALAQKYDTK